MTEDRKGGSEAARKLRARYTDDPMRARADILRALELSSGNAAAAARLLGIGVRTMRRYTKDPAVAAAIKSFRHGPVEDAP